MDEPVPLDDPDDDVEARADAYEHVREALGFDADVDPQEVIDQAAGAFALWRQAGAIRSTDVEGRRNRITLTFDSANARRAFQRALADVPTPPADPRTASSGSADR